MKIKKFFHVPNFEIYIIKEIPFNTKFYFSHFKEKLNTWNKKLASSNKFLKIYNEYLNNPEGYIFIKIAIFPSSLNTYEEIHYKN